MDFEDLIATLSKGSAIAVTTLERNVAELNELKEYQMCGSKNGDGSRYRRTTATLCKRCQHQCRIFASFEDASEAEINEHLKTFCVIFVRGSRGEPKSELSRRMKIAWDRGKIVQFTRFQRKQLHQAPICRYAANAWLDGLGA